MNTIQSSPFGNIVQSSTGSVSVQDTAPAFTRNSTVVAGNNPAPEAIQAEKAPQPVEKDEESSSSRKSDRLVDVYV